MTAPRLVFLGPPGTGKGTQALRMSDRFGLTALSSGDTLRREIREDSPIGREAAGFVSAGELVPDAVITGIMLGAIGRLPAGAGFILDGFPRTVPQAESLDRGLTGRGIGLTGVIDFRLGDAEIVERIIHRRVCTKCGASYNERSAPPASPGVCDRCGAELTQRSDDREDVVVTRLSAYRRQTAPLVDYYTQRGLLHAVDAAAPAAQIEQELAAVIAAADRGA